MSNVLVTGGGVGIGAAISKKFLALGYNVYIFTPDENTTEPDLDVKTIVVDFREPTSIYEAFEQLKTKISQLDILVNNAGIYTRCEIDEIDLTLWMDTININLTGAFLCSQNVIHMMPSSVKTYIVNIASDSASNGPRKGVHYSASKAGLIGLTKSLSNALADRNICVNVIVPGVVDTQQSNLTSERRVAKSSQIPLARVATKDDVAKAVVSLCTGGFDYMTGAKIVIDGGKGGIL